MKRVLIVLCSLAVWAPASSAKAQYVGSTVLTGTPNFQSFEGGPDSLNLGNLNINWNFQTINKPGRGQPLQYNIGYDSSLWQPITVQGSPQWSPQGQFGWTTEGTGYLTYTEALSSVTCSGTTWMNYAAVYTNFIYYDSKHTAHTFNISTSYKFVCTGTYVNPTPQITNATGTSSDGYTIYANGNTAQVKTPAGQTITFPWVAFNAPPPTGTSGGTYQNGNMITQSGGVFTDTLNTQALTVSGSQSIPPLTMAFTGPSGAESVALNYSTYTVQTAFGCSGVAEYAAASTNLPSSLTFPDGRSYRFSYEPTPGVSGSVTGRLASVTLPSGGTISYQYLGANDGVNCTDGSTMGVLRTTPDGTTSYVRSASFLPTSTTTITRPSYNGTIDQTLVTFLVAPQTGTSFTGGPITLYPAVFFETQRQEYHGSIAAGTLLRTTLHCWYAATFPSYCSNSTGMISTTTLASYAQPNSLQVTVQYPNSSGLSSGYLDSSYTNVANSTVPVPGSHIVYDFGTAGSGTFSSTPLQTINTSFVSAGPSSSPTTVPSEVTVLDGSGSTMSDVKYFYDQTAAQASGAPQLTTGLTGGNVTTIQKWVSGSTYQTSTFSYYDDGNVYIATDINGAQTTYSYAGCANAFPSSTKTLVSNGTSSVPITTQASWNCNGGVMNSSTDANGNVTTYNYGSQPVWRLASTTDPFGNVTSYGYPTTSSNSSSMAMTFNGSASVSETLTTYDSQGRTSIVQTATAPSATTYNSVQTIYDALGRTSCQSSPYSASVGATGSGSATCTTYDSLGRTSLVTDAGGGTATYTYPAANDVMVSIGPAPSGENPKRRQMEYNGAGWLTSVCEITSLAGSGTCSQNSANTGYFTQYAYYGSGNLKTVSQNVQAGTSQTQTRSLVYDGLGRKTSEVIPEWNNPASQGTSTGTYTFDSDSSGICPGTYTGDMVKSLDSAGNVTCYTYDSLHRPLSSNVVSGTYASVTPQSHFVYDVSSGTVAAYNTIGQLAEAYTCSGSCTSKLTDVFFSSFPESSGSTNTGRIVSQIWESTPHSSGYTLSQEISYPNGVVGSIAAARFSSTGTGATGSSTVSGAEQVYTYNPCANNPPQAPTHSCPYYFYDAGSIGITVNGQSVSTTYGQGASTSLLASSLVSAINATTSFPVTATLSGYAGITLTAKSSGAAGNYSYSGFSSTNMTQYFSYPSFSISVSGSTLTGGSSPTVAMLGPTVTIDVDGAGRPYSATDGTENLVNSTIYNVANGPTTITYGNSSTGSASDVDSYQYDPNMFRPTNFTYSVYPQAGAFSITGVLGWNANGSLGSMTYTDGNDSTKNQACTYSADDLSRISSVNCGRNTWEQNFSYDAFGNIHKTVPGSSPGVSYNPTTYNTATNQPSGISPTPAFDANGNQTVSGPATLSWNALAQPIQINSTTATYDALGRMVESGSGSTYQQFVFRPSGALLGLYNPTSNGFNKETVPLPGGSTAVYNASGLNFIRHTDWLGSSRLATTWAHAVYSKEAYAPFGETYNEAGTPDRSFTGRDQNTVAGAGGSGAYDFLFRRYDPSAGRWLSPDPAGWGAANQVVPASLNRYTYALNSPLNSVDPAGTDICVPSGGTLGDPKTFDSGSDPCPDGYSAYDFQQTVNVNTTPDNPIPTDCSLSVSCNLAYQLAYATLQMFQVVGAASSASAEPNATVKCRGIETDHLGYGGFQHCDAQVTDCNGAVHSISGGPDPGSNPQLLNAWNTSPPAPNFTGFTVWQGTLNCNTSSCIIETTQNWHDNPNKPLYHAATGPNSNNFLWNTFAGCGVGLPINTWGSIW